jgi:hypothetical protein
MGSPFKKFSTLTYFCFIFVFGTRFFFFFFLTQGPDFFSKSKKKKSNKAGPTLKSMNTLSKNIFMYFKTHIKNER